MRVVDFFAGLGGWTKGAKLAGAQVLFAANHWPPVVACHKLNNPEVFHVCQDAHQYDMFLVPDHDVALLSPACTGHFPNNRLKASYNSSRATAWVVQTLLEAKRPPVAIVENIPHFKRWAMFPAWCQALRALGYQLAFLEHDAADSGVPQHRKRLYIVATLSKAPLELKLPRRNHVAIGEVIQWNAYPWRPLAEKVLKTRARASSGRAAFGERFVMPYYSKGSGLTGRSLARPLGTITTRARWGVVNGDLVRMMHPSELLAAMSFPADYQLPSNVALANHFLGNAQAPFQARDIIEAVKAAA